MSREGRATRSRAARLAIVAVSVVASIAFGGAWVSGQDPTAPPGMGGMDGSTAAPPMGGMDGPTVPPVQGFYAGTEILFIHTEASDQAVADLLTGMMDSPVVLVPSLAEVPVEALATVYVFSNGLQPEGPRGPLGFQPDVFDSAPGDPDYSPLRSVALVTWADPARASMLRAAAEVEAAITEGRLTVKRTGVVVNMPFLTWPEGSR